jgi:hypothetical protein
VARIFARIPKWILAKKLFKFLQLVAGWWQTNASRIFSYVNEYLFAVSLLKGVPEKLDFYFMNENNMHYQIDSLKSYFFKSRRINHVFGVLPSR